MSHSKRNTSLAFFTSYERSLLKTSWGSQSTRLARDSFLPFSSCRLCLLPSRDPVACASHGDIFCRECAVSNLLAQRKEIKRLERDDERRRAERTEQDEKDDDDARRRAVTEFERVQAGLEGKLGGERGRKKVVGRADGKVVVEVEEEEEEEEAVVDGEKKRTKKRKFELDEDELLRIAREDRSKAKKALDDEKSAKSTLPSFWVPSLTPSLDTSTTSTSTAPGAKPRKSAPICPASTPAAPHTYTLKTLVTCHFTEETPGTNANSNAAAADKTATVRICPACRKPLNNAAKAMLTIPCGHILCRPCTLTFMQPVNPSSTSSSTNPSISIPSTAEDVTTCYVCDTRLSAQPSSKRTPKDKERDKDRHALTPGVVQISSEGTGFAGAGDNVVRREGVVFQC